MGDLLGQDWTPGNKSLFKALRGDLRDARAARDREADASGKVSAARAGQVRCCRWCCCSCECSFRVTPMFDLHLQTACMPAHSFTLECKANLDVLVVASMRDAAGCNALISCALPQLAASDMIVYDDQKNVSQLRIWHATTSVSLLSRHFHVCRSSCVICRMALAAWRRCGSAARKHAASACRA
jgi:hypothetical protein